MRHTNPISISKINFELNHSSLDVFDHSMHKVSLTSYKSDNHAVLAIKINCLLPA